MTLIFDLDGTLVDCKQLHRDGFRWAATQQIPTIQYNDEDVEGLSTIGKIKLLQNNGYNLTLDIDDYKRQYTNNHIEQYVKYNDALCRQIYRIYNTGIYKMCIASNSRSEFVYRCMNILKLWQFECVYSRDYGLTKPDPWMYNECMRICNSTPNDTIIFEDSIVGIEGATKTGATVVRVENSWDLIEKLYEY